MKGEIILQNYNPSFNFLERTTKSIFVYINDNLLHFYLIEFFIFQNQSKMYEKLDKNYKKPVECESKQISYGTAGFRMK